MTLGAGAGPSVVVQEPPLPCPQSYGIEVCKSPSPEGGLTSEYGIAMCYFILLMFYFIAVINSGVLKG